MKKQPRKDVMGEAEANSRALEQAVALIEDVRLSDPIEALRFKAANALLQLQEMAKTDVKALDVLASELMFQVNLMNKRAMQNLDHARKLSSRCVSWPCVATADTDVKRLQDHIRAQLQLGTRTQESYNRSGKRWSRQSPQVRAALALRQCLLGHKVQLPPYDKSTAVQWWAEADRLFLNKLFGERFEDHPLFSGFWTLRPKAGVSRRAWVRAEIKAKIKQAFQSIAPKPSAF